MIPPALYASGRVFYEDQIESERCLSDFGNIQELPVVYIVIPTYNSGSTLEKTVRSLILQRYPNLRIVVYDGGSTSDETLEILTYYQSFLSRVESLPDEGQADVINKGFFAAPDGAILGWLNADDILLPNALNSMVLCCMQDESVKAGIRQNEAIMIVGDADLVDINLSLIHAKRLSVEQLDCKVLIDYRNNYIIQPSCFFTKSLWDSAGPTNKDLYAAFDFELFYKMAGLAKRKIHIPVVMSYSVFHEDCKTVRQKHLSIAETALVQAREGGFSHALREVRELSKEYKFLENVLKETKYTKPAILVSITEFGLGGAQTFLITLLRRISTEFRIYLYRHWTHQTSSELLAEVVQYCEDITDYVNNTAEGMRAFLTKKGIRLVLSNLYHSDSYMARVCQSLNIKLIIVDHGDYRFVVEDGLADLDDVKHIFSIAFKVVFTSYRIKDQALLRYFSSPEEAGLKLEYIPLPCEPIDTPYSHEALCSALDLPMDTFLVSYSARGILSKGWSFAFEAVVRANSISNRPIALIGTGSGPVIDVLKHQSMSSYPLSNYFRFLGFRKDAPVVSAACHAAMMLSYYPGETLNLTLIESLLAGNPCIATDWGAMGEVLEYSTASPSGIPVDMHDGYPCVSGATNALARLANDDDAYMNTKRAAVKRGLHYQAARICDLYRDLLTLWATS